MKLISTDFDGTLFSEFELPPVPRALEALLGRLQTAGAHWVINTGRDMSGLMECLGRARLGIRPDYLVLVEREVYRHQGSRYVPVEAWNNRCHRQHEELFQRVRRDLPRLTRWINSRFDATLYEDSFSPLCLIAGSNEDADAIVEHLEAYCRTVPCLTVMRNDVYARFSHTDFTKGTALGEIARLLRIAPEYSLAAGDHFNDLPMLKLELATRLIAPANAVDCVKETVRTQGGYLSRAARGEGVLEGLRHYLGESGWELNE